MPISSLHQELLEQIFALACLYPAGFLLSEETPGPIVLSSICQRWRAISLNLPSIWSSIYINITPFSDLRDEVLHLFLRRLQLFIERSKDRLLDLQLFLNFDASKASQPLLDAMALLAGTWHRWGRLEITMPAYSVLSEWQAITNNLRALHTLIFDPNLHARRLLNLFGDLPSLRRFEFGIEPMSAGLEPHQQAFRGLESLKMTGHWDGRISSREMYNLLTTFTELRTLSVSNVLKDYDTPPDTPDQLISRNIESLTLGTLDAFDHLPFIFPHLSVVTFNFLGPNWSSEGFVTLLQRSACSITSLTFHKPYTSDEGVISLLKHVSSLVDLTVREVLDEESPHVLTARFFKEFGDASQFLPNLRRLNVLFETDLLDVQAFVDAVKSRKDVLRFVNIEALGTSELLESLKTLPNVEIQMAVKRVVQ